MLIISSLGGGNDFTVEMPTMEDCLAARIEIQKQDDSLKTLCIPSVDETAKVQEFFDIFLDMIEQIKEKEDHREGYVCDSSVLPGLVIHTVPPRINCDELPESPLWLPKPDWKPDHPLWKE